MSGHAILQVAAIWRGQIIGYRLLARRRRITVGPSKRATFNTPPLDGRARYLLVRPRKGAYVVHLAAGLRGEVTLGGIATAVEEIANRDVTLSPGDKAKLTFTEGDLRLELRWVEPPEVLARPRVRDPQMVQITVGTAAVLGVFALLLNLIWTHDVPKPPLVLDASRVAKIEAPQA